MKKRGTPSQRTVATGLLRKARAMWPTLQGGWTRKEWNYQASLAARKYLRKCAMQQYTTAGTGDDVERAEAHSAKASAVPPNREQDLLSEEA